MRKIKKEYYSSISKLKKYLKIFEKIWNLNHKVYNKIIPENGVEFNNLERVIWIKKYKENIYLIILDEIYMALRKFKSNNILKKKLKVSAINEFKSVNEIYFGIPV